MIPGPHNLGSIKVNDLDALVNTTRENRVIDFKERFYEDKQLPKELAKDVAAFANTDGGCILIGVKEDAGIATEICGIDVEDQERLLARVQHVVSSNVRPIPLVQFEGFELSNKRKVIAIGVPASRHKPHMVMTEPVGTFYKRTDAGTSEPMSVDEIRVAFTSSLGVEEAAHRLHHDFAVSYVSRTEVSVALSIIPLPIDQTRLDFRKSTIRDAARNVRAIRYSGAFNSRITFDGMLSHQPSQGHFRQLVTHEAAVFGVYEMPDRQSARELSGSYLLKELGLTLKSIFRFLTTVEVPPPAILNLSLHACEGCRLLVGAYGDGVGPIDRKELWFDSILIEDYQRSPHEYIRDAMDRLWQAANCPQCDLYDESGVLRESLFVKWYGQGGY